MRRTDKSSLKAQCACSEAAEIHQTWSEAFGPNEQSWGSALREMVGESIERANALDSVRRQALEEIAEHGSVIFGCKHEKWALLAQDPVENSCYRVTWFDARGFIGHATVRTPEEGVSDAFDTHRIHVAPRDTLDRIAGTAEFLEGCRRLEEARQQWLTHDQSRAAP